MTYENKHEPSCAPSISPERGADQSPRRKIRLFVDLSIQRSTRELLDLWGYDVGYDGCWIQLGAPSKADRPELIDDFLKVEPISYRTVLEELILYVAEEVGIKINASILKASLGREIRRRQSIRKQNILKPLLAYVAELGGKVKDEERKLASCFEMEGNLAIGLILHEIYQVKRKVLNLPVTNHLMLVIYSKAQGTGKTTFVRRFVEPLAELASADVLLSQFSDPRSGDIYRFPMVVVDDMEGISKSDVAVLKSLITATYINRRTLFTSSSSSMRQVATLIGTANKPVTELIDDETGHRRFVMMPFCNGNGDRGGDSRIWDVVNSIDFPLLWKSVNPFQPSPIGPLLAELHQHQNQYRPVSTLLKWLRGLDLKSEKIKAICYMDGVRAEMLRDLFMRETGEIITRQKFADDLEIYMGDESVPVYRKYKKVVGAVYLPRPSVLGAP